MKNNYNCPICGECCSYKDEFVIDKTIPKTKQYFHRYCFDELLNRKKVDNNEQTTGEKEKKETSSES